MDRIDVVLVDVNGSCKRLFEEAPKKLKQFLGTAVFLTSSGVKRDMEAGAQLGPGGEGLTPDTHIKFEIEWMGNPKALSQRVGVFTPGDADVALYNEYSPDHQPFMVPAAKNNSALLLKEATIALQKVERYFTGF